MTIYCLFRVYFKHKNRTNIYSQGIDEGVYLHDKSIHWLSQKINSRKGFEQKAGKKMYKYKLNRGVSAGLESGREKTEFVTIKRLRRSAVYNKCVHFLIFMTSK